MGKDQRILSQEIRGKFMEIDFPIPFGLLENLDVDLLPCNRKMIMSDAFYRAWAYHANESPGKSLIFDSVKRGGFYKDVYPKAFLKIVMTEFEKMNFIRKVSGSETIYQCNIIKFIHERKLR